jgi:hypothetical protein
VPTHLVESRYAKVVVEGNPLGMTIDIRSLQTIDSDFGAPDPAGSGKIGLGGRSFSRPAIARDSDQSLTRIGREIHSLNKSFLFAAGT